MKKLLAAFVLLTSLSSLAQELKIDSVEVHEARVGNNPIVYLKSSQLEGVVFNLFCSEKSTIAQIFKDKKYDGVRLLEYVGYSKINFDDCQKINDCAVKQQINQEEPIMLSMDEYTLSLEKLPESCQ